MQRRQFRSLLALNLLLLAVLAAVTFAPVATAQTNRPSRASGDYSMVSGKAQGLTEHVVYVVDSINRDVLAIQWDRSRKNWQGIGYRNLTDDSSNPNRRGR